MTHMLTMFKKQQRRNKIQLSAFLLSSGPIFVGYFSLSPCCVVLETGFKPAMFVFVIGSIKMHFKPYLNTTVCHFLLGCAFQKGLFIFVTQQKFLLFIVSSLRWLILGLFCVFFVQWSMVPLG